VTACLAYVTTASRDEALRIGRAMVEDRLAACANLIDPMTSIYRWQGKIEEGRECVLILKTELALIDALTARVKALHSYTVPCVVAWPIAAGNADFLRWIGDETLGAGA
jgi:periplasmic divalent cation tolerance protein